MSTGVVGAIDPGGVGTFSIHYAVAATFNIQSGWRNKTVAHCKRCGNKLERGDGVRVVISDVGGPMGSLAYFCQPCADWVQASTQVVMERRAKDARGETSQLGQTYNR